MAKASAKSQFTKSYESLEDILEQFRSGDLSLDASLALFEKGIGHLRMCQEELTKAKGTVEVLVQNLQDDGEIVTEPIDD